jgi:hypothetical protein
VWVWVSGYVCGCGRVCVCGGEWVGGWVWVWVSGYVCGCGRVCVCVGVSGWVDGCGCG